MGFLKVGWIRNDQRGDIFKTGQNKVHFYKDIKIAQKDNKGALFLLESTVCQMSFDCTFKLVQSFYPFDFLGKRVPVMNCSV